MKDDRFGLTFDFDFVSSFTFIFCKKKIKIRKLKIRKLSLFLFEKIIFEKNSYFENPFRGNKIGLTFSKIYFN